MRILRLLLILLLMPLLARAASPSFNSFLSTQFTNNGVVIGLNTNYVLTWQMVNVTDFTTNGNNLAVNTNTFPTIPTVADMIRVATNISTTNLWQVFNGTNVFRALGHVGIGISTPDYPLHVNSVYGPSQYAVMVTNTTSGGFVALRNVTGIAVVEASSAGAAEAFLGARGGVSSVVNLISDSNTSGQRNVWIRNSGNRVGLQSFNDDATLILSEPFTVTNASPTGTLTIGLDGIVRFNAAAGGFTFSNAPAMRQFTVATNAVRVYGLGGITVSPSNNTANGSLDYRITSAGDTNFPHLNVTNGVLYGTSLWTASSDTTNFILNPALNERTINMAANVRVTSLSAFNPAGFRGFVGVLITNNSGSSFNFDVTNTIVPFGTNTLTIPTGKAARVVFQIDENRAFWGGAVQP